MSASEITTKKPLKSILIRHSSPNSLKLYVTQSISPVQIDGRKTRKPKSSLISTFNPIFHFFSPPHKSAIPSVPKEEPQPISVARALAIIIICVTAFVVSNATSLSLNLLIPSIQRELDIEASDLQWISSGFPLGFGSCLLLFGRLADVYGHKRFIQLGTSFYALASLGCALSRTHVQLSVLRVFQGLGAAATAPSLIGVLGNHLEPESTLKRVGFACLSAGAPLGGTFGLLVGGFITQGTGPGWRSFFYLCAASAIGVCVSATLIIPKDKQRVNKEGSIDWLGGILIITGLSLLTFALGISSREGWTRVVVLLPFICAVIILASFVFWQKVLEDRMTESLKAGDGWNKPTEPILKLDLFRRDHHQFSIVLSVVCLLWFGFVIQNFFFHQYLQDFLGLDLTQSVIRFIPMLVLGLLLNIAFGFLSHIIPAQLLMVLGCIGTATSCLLSALMDTSASYWTYNFASVALSVVGPDFVFATGTMYGSQISSQSEQAVTGGVFHTFAQMGNAIGLSLATLLQVQVTRSRAREEGMIVRDDLTVASPGAFLEGLRAGFWLCFGALCLATLLSLVFLRKLKLLGKKKTVDSSSSSIEEKGEQKIERRGSETSTIESP
ncbi:hypothetical protein PtA15_8A561 [Puccinia triticina]|uniref:Major facilitator superfamily (MFS) profile domain-containing protein n=1 Tax=Puccinia triticina TaxID=208348 RepID=A0ABY7CRK2_9BASI|nr:uncharacterized protein PtA15_8A561 [Puccinia triticina]WAQ87655.1 hypothetical protein PtA15_8A561 [Puccinia triticina]WAR57515.1 hypothetical protein PtB15_8B565 [Puccinia triticina]